MQENKADEQATANQTYNSELINGLYEIKHYILL